MLATFWIFCNVLATFWHSSEKFSGVLRAQSEQVKQGLISWGTFFTCVLLTGYCLKYGQLQVLHPFPTLSRRAIV